jgi:hypothetical protein
MIRVKIEKLTTGSGDWSDIVNNFGMLSNEFTERLVV